MSFEKHYELRFLPLFYDDLLKTVSYIARDLGNAPAAQKLADEIQKAIRLRVPFAEAFEPYHSTKMRDAPIYPIYVGNYVVYYAVLDHKIMEVRRLLYGGRDRPKFI